MSLTLASLGGCGSDLVEVSESETEASGASSGDGDGDPGGDGDSTGDEDPGGGDWTGDGDSSGELDPEPDLPQACFRVHHGWLALDEDTTEADFAALDCVEEITGNLIIDAITADNLEFLSALVRVGGKLIIRDNPALVDLSGLEALEEVGGEIVIADNPALSSLAGLASLHALGGLLIEQNQALISVAGLGGALHMSAQPNQAYVGLRVVENPSLTSLDGFASVTELTVEEPLELDIIDNSQLGGDLFGLADLVSDAQFLSLRIEGNALAGLDGLEALTQVERIDLLGPDGHFVDLSGLDNLTSVVVALWIGDCDYVLEVCPDAPTISYGLDHLESLDGLESLVEVGHLKIWGNMSLVDIDALAGLASAGTLEILQNPVLPQAVAESVVAGVEVSESMSVIENGLGGYPQCTYP